MQFVYEAIGKTGRVVTGRAAASSIDALHRDLAAAGLSPIDVRRDLLGEVAGFFRAKELSRDVLIDLFGYLHGLMAMGMDMITTWESLEESLDDKTAKDAIATIRQAIAQGATLTDGMARAGVFPTLVIGSVKAGETSGSLEKVFAKLEEHYREEAELVRQVSKATVYPIVSAIVLLFIFLGLLVYVVPQLRDVFPKNPPVPTRILLWSSDRVVKTWWALPAAPTLAVFVWLTLSPARKSRIWEAMYRVPVLGPTLKNLALCNVFFNFSLMLGAGVSLVQALDTLLPITPSRVIRAKLAKVQDTIAKGGMFAEGFRDPFFPSVVASAIYQGETTGRLDLYMQRIATFLRTRAQARMHALSTLAEPALLLGAGSMLLVFALGIFMPIYGSLRNFGK